MSPLVVTGIYWSYAAHSACETVLHLFHNAFSPFNLVPLPSGLQPFLFKGISRKHEWQHPPEPNRTAGSTTRSLGQQSPLGLAWPRSRGGDGRQGRGWLASTSTCPPREAHPWGAATAPGNPPRWLPGVASRSAIPHASPKIRCQIRLCSLELQPCNGNVGPQSSVFVGNHELGELLSLETENLISWGVCRGRRWW